MKVIKCSFRRIVCGLILLLSFLLPGISTEAAGPVGNGRGRTTGFVLGQQGECLYFENGVWAENYTGLYKDAVTGWWLVENGRVTFSYNDVFFDMKTGWWKITNSAVDVQYTGWYVSKTIGACHITNGQMDFFCGFAVELPKDMQTELSADAYYELIKKSENFAGISHILTMQAYENANTVLSKKKYRMWKKTIACFGDSITWGAHHGDGGVLNYPVVMQTILPGSIMLNYGVPGSSISRFGSDPMVDRYCVIPQSANVIIVMGGVNDLPVVKAGFGDVNTCLPGTFCGDLNEMLFGLRYYYPKARIVLCTPFDTVISGENVFQNMPSLSQYADAMMVLGERYGMQVIDFYHSGLMNTYDTTARQVWFEDEVHPNDAGYSFLATYLAAYLVN